MAVYEQLLRVGAIPLLQMILDVLDELLYRCGHPIHFDTLPALELAMVRRLDARIGIGASCNTRAHLNRPSERARRYSKARRPLHNLLRRVRKVITAHPKQAYAQEAEMTLRE